jgi:hypothetical protein
MVTSFKDIKTRQQRVATMITNGDCTISCAGAIYTDGDCHCRCHGLNHGALWIDELVAHLDKGI